MREFLIIVGMVLTLFWALLIVIIGSFALTYEAWLLVAYCACNLIVCWLALQKLAGWLPNPEPVT